MRRRLLETIRSEKFKFTTGIYLLAISLVLGGFAAVSYAVYLFGQKEILWLTLSTGPAGIVLFFASIILLNRSKLIRKGFAPQNPPAPDKSGKGQK